MQSQINKWISFINHYSDNDCVAEAIKLVMSLQIDKIPAPNTSVNIDDGEIVLEWATDDVYLVATASSEGWYWFWRNYNTNSTNCSSKPKTKLPSGFIDLLQSIKI